MDTNKLYLFIKEALRETYAKLGVNEIDQNQGGFKVLRYDEKDLRYTDSYTGFFKSRGFIVVRQLTIPIWMCSYGGGMKIVDKDLAIETFSFLKQAFLSTESGFDTFRGPHHFQKENWKYQYEQVGDVSEFYGTEHIYKNEKEVFFHRIIGGMIIDLRS